MGLYLDDVPITYDAPDPDLRLVDIDRVEVLRGPQGTLYGSGSIGGVVKIVTNRPDPTAYSADILLTGGPDRARIGIGGAMRRWSTSPSPMAGPPCAGCSIMTSTAATSTCPGASSSTRTVADRPAGGWP